jgi:hypothetical protein
VTPHIKKLVNSLAAHAERYGAIQADPDASRRLIDDAGVL